MTVPDLPTLRNQSRKRTRAIFGEDSAAIYDVDEEISHRERISSKIRSEYENVKELPFYLSQKTGKSKKQPPSKPPNDTSTTPQMKLIEDVERNQQKDSSSTALTVRMPTSRPQTLPSGSQSTSQALTTPRRENYVPIKPTWHAPWKLRTVISGHLGWVRCVAVEPGNQWFCTGSADRIIKIWDLASGTLRLSLTGHIAAVRGLAVSSRHPYLFSCGEDRMVKCWDLEQNKVIRQYHGHLSGVYTLALHPTLDVLVTGGRDATARVWDMRTRQNVHVLSGHSGSVVDVKCQEADPQVISGSFDTTVRLWDLAAGKSMAVLTHHKKQVRSLAIHPTEFVFASASSDNIKQWKCPEGAFMQNFEGHNAIVNTIAVNADGVLFSGGDNGSMKFWDWKSGYNYQSMDMIVQPGSLSPEAGVMTSTFDRTGLRLITGNVDKTIHIYGQDDEATEETHPIDWKPTLHRRKY